MIFIDLDNFKQVNDKCGHEKGDEILKDISKKLRTSLRGIDAVARWGGEEFVILLLGATEDQAADIAEKLRVMIEKTGKEFGVTASLGVAALSACQSEAFDILVTNADKAMYHSKESGKNIVSRYSKFL